MQKAESFTGRTRKRTTRRSVLVADRVSRALITVGGIGTILAVLGVFFFLVWVVLPLFKPAEITEAKILSRDERIEPLHLGMDEYQLLAWTLLPSGRLDVFRLDSGAILSSQQVFEPGLLTSASFLLRGELAVFGLSDGIVRLAQVGFETRILGADDLPATLLEALDGRDESAYANHEEGVVQRTRQGQYRLQRLAIELGSEIRVGDGPVRRIHHVIGPNGPLIAALTEEPAGYRIHLIVGEEQSNFLTGKTSLDFKEPIPISFAALGSGAPEHLALAGSGNTLLVAWADGSMVRVDLSDPLQPYDAEQLRIVDAGSRLTALDFILGNNTLVWGDEAGKTSGGFLLRLSDYHGQGTGDIEVLKRDTERNTATFVQSKTFEKGRAAALCIAASARSRLVLVGYANGEILLSNVTHQATLATFGVPSGKPVTQLVMAPKEDGLLALTGGDLYHARLDPGYPEASFGALFRPVWYEGYSEPLHVWQSSSGTDDFEMKLGLMPLVFGTLKATLYSMIFGVPLALLAAIFTSEFLHPKAKAVIKPSIELMASLPSVVLGFLAALVFAPFAERVVPATLTGFVTIPFMLLLGAYFWQLLPSEAAVRLANKRFLFILLTLPVGVWLAVVLGPVVEKLLFAGDIKGWLAWDAALSPPELDPFRSSTGGWMLLLTPLSAFTTALVMSRFVKPWMRQQSAPWNRHQLALIDLAKFVIGIFLMLGMAYVLSAALSGLGFDPRGSYVDTYVQRNALIVGFVMGFAIIPIIYTLSEDALSTVPDHLRAASLGAGATQWQTAIRIVIPTAMSGLFSAMMVGLGRAVGETMIVLMAAGNTPVMEWNIFEGFRTLSANIAVELPEAVRNSTHYRTLFLAALTLFAMTFIVNTVAEIIRLRFRKRAYQL